jgi:hypothetical protein
MRTDDKVECAGCGVRHFRGLSWAHTKCLVANRVDSVANESSVVANKPAVVANSEGEVVANKKGKYRDAEKRRGYMKAYMARRRAMLKGG